MAVTQSGQGRLGVILAAATADPALVEAVALAGGSAVVTGANVIAHFSSAVSAMECALAWRRTQAAPAAIAVSLGMVAANGQSGDAVDGAVAMLARATPGDFWAAENVRGLVADKIALVFRRAPGGDWLADFDADPNQPPPKTRRAPAIAAVAVFAVAAGALWFVLAGDVVNEPVQVATPANMALPLPQLPSVAIVQFAVAEGQALPDHAARGMAAGLAQALGVNPGLFVMKPAAGPGFTGADTAVEVAEALGVRFVFLGVIHPDDTPMELRGQLVDALTGLTAWQGARDLAPPGIAALAQELTAAVLAPDAASNDAAQPANDPGPVAALARPVDAAAFDLYVRGRTLMAQATVAANAQAGALFREALELDPEFTAATIELGFTLYFAAQGLDGDLTGDVLPELEDVIRAAMQQAPDDPRGLALQSRLEMLRGTMFRGGVEAISPRYLALDFAQRAVALAPNDPDNLAHLSRLYTFGIRTSQEGLEMIERAMRINPNYPWTYQHVLAQNYQLTGRYEEAVAVLLAALERAPAAAVLHRELALSYVLAENVEAARLHIAELLRLVPDYTVATESRESIYLNPLNLERDVIALRRAGLPFAYREP